MLHYNATVWCWTILWLIWLHQPNKLWGKIHMQKPLIQYNYHLNNDYQNGNQNEERHQHQHPHHHHHHHQQHNHSPNHHYRHYPHYFHQQYHHRKHQSEEQAEQQKQQQQEQHIYQLSDYDLVEMTATTTTTTDINDIVSPRLIDEEEGVNLEGDPKIESTQLNVNNNDNSQEFTMRVASAKHHQQKSLQQQEQQQHNGNVVTTTASATYPYATTIPLSHSNNSQSNTARIISTIQVEAETQINPHRDSNLDGREGIINLYALTDKKAQLTPRLKSKKTAAATTTTPTSTATANSIQTPDFAMTKHASSNSLKYQQQQQQQLQEEEEEEREIKENGERIGESKEQEKQLEEEQVRYNYNSNNNNNNNNNDNINNNNHNDNQNNNNSNTAKSFLARHTKFNLNTLNGHYRHHHHRQHHQHTHQHHQQQQQQQHHHQSHELLVKKDSARDQTEYGGRQLEQNQNHNQDEDELDDTDADADTEADDYYEEDDEYAFRHNHDNDNDNDNDTEIHDDNNDIDDNNNNDDDIDDDDENMLDQIDKDNGSSSSNNKKNKNEISNNNDNNNNSSPSVDTVLNDDDNLSDRSYTRITRSRLDYDYADDEPQYHNTIVDDFRERERDRDRNSNIDGVPSPPGVITEQKYSEVGNEKAVQQARERYVQQQENNKRPRTPHELATDHWHRMIVATKCRKPMPRVIPVSNNTSKRYEPYATILYRCGEDTGCCGSTASVCTVKRYDIVMVYVFSYDFNYRKEIEALPMHNHTECHCVNRGNLIVHDTSSPRGKRSGQNYKSQHQHQHQYQYQQRQQQQQQHQHQSQHLKLWAQSTDKRWRRSDVISNLLHQHHHQQQHLQQKEQQLSQHCNYTNFNCLCPQHFHHFEEEVERHAHLPQSHDIITHKCHCDCLPKDYLCERYKRGEELLNREDRKCINDGCCKPPTCLHGDYNIKLGKCPSIHRTTIENYPKILPYQSHHHNHRKQHQSQSTTSQDRSHLIKLDLN